MPLPAAPDLPEPPAQPERPEPAGVDAGWLRAAVLAATRATLAGLPPGDYCGYALYSDEGAMTVCCAVNTVQHLARVSEPGDPDYWRWYPAEWALEGIGDFDEICWRLRTAVADTGGAAFVEFRDMVFETCVAALETLVAEGAFNQDQDRDRDADADADADAGAGAGAGVVVFAVSDTDDPERDVAWIRRLNPAARADEFARWVGALPG